ncbi:MAG: sigma-54 dependent transcriptional regulator [Candidatus Brocadiia bacterium]
MKRVLIVDDDVAVTNYLMVFLAQTDSYESEIVNDSRTVPDILAASKFDVILLDMDMPGLSGLDILKLSGERRQSTPIIILTGVSDVEQAVKAMKLGAFDYLTKPVDDEHLLKVLDNAIKQSEINSSILELPDTLKQEDLQHREAFEHLPTMDPEMIRLFHSVERMASGDLTIFIWGERGTGKESLARAIHKASPRSKGPFIAVDADAQNPDAFAADFFGQARDWSGSREESTGFVETAEGGTLFLDNVDALPLPVQVRFKRLLQTREYYRECSTEIRMANVRFTVASQHDLTRDEYKNSFSRDLLYHLMVNSIRLPSLRERPLDVQLLANRFCAEEAEKSGRKPLDLSPEFMQFIAGYDFPDNLQELRTLIASCVVNEEGQHITVESISPYTRERINRSREKAIMDFRPRKLQVIAREHIMRMLLFFGNDRARTAAELGVSLETMDKILSPRPVDAGQKDVSFSIDD